MRRFKSKLAAVMLAIAAIISGSIAASAPAAAAPPAGHYSIVARHCDGSTVTPDYGAYNNLDNEYAAVSGWFHAVWKDAAQQMHYSSIKFYLGGQLQVTYTGFCNGSGSMAMSAPDHPSTGWAAPVYIVVGTRCIDDNDDYYEYDTGDYTHSRFQLFLYAGAVLAYNQEYDNGYYTVYQIAQSAPRNDSSYGEGEYWSVYENHRCR